MGFWMRIHGTWHPGVVSVDMDTDWTSPNKETYEHEGLCSTYLSSEVDITRMDEYLTRLEIA